MVGAKASKRVRSGYSLAMLLDTITLLVRRHGPFRMALVVTASVTGASVLATAVTMTALDSDVFPALYLATFTPLSLALPVTYLAFLALEKGDLASQRYEESQRQAQEAQAILSDAVANIPNPTLILDADDRIMLFNDAWRAHYPEAGHIIQLGTSFEDLAHYVASTGLWDSMGPRDEVLARRLRHHRQAAGSFVQDLADGRSMLVYEGRSASGVGIVTHTDVTELKRVDRLKDEFISTVSHELRTPLTSIKGALDLLVGGIEVGQTSDSAKLVEIAQRNSDRLLTLVNDILDVQVIEAGSLVVDLKAVDLAPLLDRNLAAVDVLARRFGVVVRRTGEVPDACVMADANRVDQVLTNLVSNATKFAPRGSTVTIGATRLDGVVRISVHDTGRGIPPTQQGQVFERFWQADASNARGTSGTGLGLSISKKIVETMGGRIGFDSDPDQGTTFYFDLPLADATAGVAARESVLQDD
jgi:signal transduction histidine kinase